jgi:hypothetical protein
LDGELATTQVTPIALESFVHGQNGLFRLDSIDPASGMARARLLAWDGTEANPGYLGEYPLGAIQLRKENAEAQRAILELIVQFFFDRKEPELSFLKGFRVMFGDDFSGSPSLFVDLVIDKYQGTMQDAALKRRVELLNEFKGRVAKQLERVQLLMRLDSFPYICFSFVGER